MSAKKFVGGDSFEQPVTVEARQASLELSADTVVIHKSGIEFRSPAPFNPWTEMTVALQPPGGGGRLRQQTRRLPRLDGFHQPHETGADTAEFDGALGSGRGLSAKFSTHFAIFAQPP
jgi:hypothetical protein